MLPGSDSMGAPSSFTARRPNASNLPNFELPPPQLSHLHQKYSYNHASSQPPSSLTSVGNLLTPPSGLSGDGLSPVSSGVNTGSIQSNQQHPPYTPNGYMWPAQSSGTNPYGLQSGNGPNSYLAHRGGLFSPSLNSLVRGTHSPTTSEGLPPPTYGEVPPFPTSMSMSAPASLPALPPQQHSIGSAMMGGQQQSLTTPATQSSPVTTQDSYARLPPTPSFYHSSQQPSAPQQSTYPYSSGPSPVQQSPLSAGGQMPRMSPTHGHGSIPPLQQHSAQSPYGHHRPFQYPMPGPVLSNVGNPNSQLALVGQMYGHPQAHQPNSQNDRPFKCDQCPQSFNRNHDLKRHKRIHLAVKPFPCGHCDKSFSRKDALKRHILVKGCGKAHSSSVDGDKADGSISPSTKSGDSSPVVPAPA
ncbi:hypothetical protein BDV97DRAFT_375063 [Delphinella strobiligena]|nr:hypothetical protein BDV97DRAFT_375063 [Delphinella strobiligena]